MTLQNKVISMDAKNGIFLHRYLKTANSTSANVLELRPIALELIEKCDDLIAQLVSAGHETLGPVGHPLALNSYFLFLASIRTALSGHPAAVHSTLRSALEYACYAFLIVEKQGLAEIWLNRNSGEEGFKAHRKAFAPAVSDTAKAVKKYDPEIESRITALYDAAIDFGGHPNPRSLQAHITSSKGEGGDLSVLNCLYPWGEQTGRGLLACLEFGITITHLLIVTTTKCPPVQETKQELIDLMTRKDRVALQHYGLISEPGMMTYNKYDSTL